jgi:hypothetical protein
MPLMDARRTYFLGNQVMWALALLLGPIAFALAGSPVFAVIVVGLFVLPSFILFDTDRPWWPAEVRDLPQDHQRSQAERWKLTISSGIALAIGFALAFLRPWQ